MSNRSPDQDRIDALWRELDREQGGSSTNGSRNGLIYKEPAAPASSITDERVIELCRQAKNSAKFASLFDDGDTSAYGGDDSDADAGLLGIMALYTKDPEQLERLWARSALAKRGKFNRADYRHRTISYVLSEATESYRDPGSGRILLSSSSGPLGIPSDDDNNESSDEDSSDAEIVWFSKLGKPKPRRHLIKDVCAKGYPLIVFGAGGVAKSFGTLLAGIAIAGGYDEWLGLRIMEHGTVLYLDFELEAEEQHRRVRDLCAGEGIPIPEQLAYLSGVGRTVEKTFWNALKFCKEHEAVAVIIDSMGLAMQGDMEHARDVLAFHANYINPFRALGVTPLVVDHQGKLQTGEKHKDKSPYGSAYKAWVARSVLQFQYEEYSRETHELDIRVRQTKTNFGPALEPFGVRFTFEVEKISTEIFEIEDAELAEEDTVPAQERILGVLQKGPATNKEIQDSTGLAVGTVRNKLSDLMQEGTVGEDGYQGRSKVYRLLSSSPGNPRGTSDDDNKKAGGQAVLGEEF